MPCKHKDLHGSPDPTKENWVWWYMFIIFPVPGKRPAHLQGLLASQPHLQAAFQISEEQCLTKEGRWHLMNDTWGCPLMCTHAHTNQLSSPPPPPPHTCAHARTPSSCIHCHFGSQIPFFKTLELLQGRDFPSSHPLLQAHPNIRSAFVNAIMGRPLDYRISWTLKSPFPGAGEMVHR